MVEKDDDILQIISHILIDEGYQPILCRSEEGIFDIIKFNKPDVILLDIVKPSEQGTELCRAIKAMESTKDIPVIVLSTHPHVDQVKDICADEIVKKPFDISFLIHVVKEQLAA